MRRLAELRIRTKLILIIIFTCNIALLLASITIITYDNYTYRAQKAEEVSAQAGVLAAGMIATLEFEDRKSAQEDLNPLATNPEIMVAAVYTSDGLLFASYIPKGNVSKKTKLSSRGRCSRTSAK
jgi:two-component system sensor histidine kinase BarA